MSAGTFAPMRSDIIPSASVACQLTVDGTPSVRRVMRDRNGLASSADR